MSTSEDQILPKAEPSAKPTGTDNDPIIDVQPFHIDESANPTRTKFCMGAILLALYVRSFPTRTLLAINTGQLALFIAALDQTIIATAIPTIAAQLHSTSGYAWIASAYFIADAAAGPIWAKFSDIWGRKPALLGSVLLFAIASIVAALSHSVGMLIVARALQGAGAGGLIQLVNITISDLFSMRERTLYLGLVNVVWGLAGGVGPLIGGAFTQYVSWRFCFWINLPICGLSFALLLIFLDVFNPKTAIKEGMFAFDWLGTLSILGVTLLLLLGLDFGGVTFPWDSPTVICLVIFGVVMIGIFLFTEKRVARYPLVPFEVFRNRSNSAAFAVCFCHGMLAIGAWYYLPFYLQSVKQASPLRSGLLILPVVLPESGMGFVNAFIMLNTGHYREIIWVGLILLTVGVGLYISFTPATSIATIVGFEIIQGLGSGCLFEAPMVAIQAVTDQGDVAAATGTFGFMRNIAIAISLVLGGVVFQNGMDRRTADLRLAGLDGTLIEAFSDGKAAANVELIRTISNPAQRAAVELAFALSLRNMWTMYCCIGAMGLVVSVFIAHSHLSTEHTETKTGLKEKERDESV